MKAQPTPRPTVIDYLLRAGDAFTASLALLTPDAAPDDEVRARRLAVYADRCAFLAARTAGRDTSLLERAVETRDMASRAEVIVTEVQHARATRPTLGRAA